MTPDLEALRRDLAADPENQSLRAAVGRMEARRVIRGRAVRLVRTLKKPRSRGMSQVAGKAARHALAYHGSYRHRRFFRPACGTSIGYSFGDRLTEMVALENAWITCKRCRRALGLDARGGEDS